MNIQTPDTTIIELNNKDKKTIKQNYIEPKLEENDNEIKEIQKTTNTESFSNLQDNFEKNYVEMENIKKLK